MSWDNFFPTRQGGSIGKSLEGDMLDKVGGPNTIRTDIRSLPDGSEVMLRTRGGHPEFTVKKAVKAVQEVYSSWAWPWHGLARNSTAGVQVTEVGAIEIATRGTPPAIVGPKSFSFIPFCPSKVFSNITAPKTPTEGATWVNWAAISNGVLFGSSVGMNTWLYTSGSKSWVVVATISVASVTLNLYSLDNWVEGMPESSAVDFVKYDRVPTPYMVKNPPSGAVRTPVATLTKALPAYYRTTTGTLRVKRGDVSFDGSRIILAYEVTSPDTQLMSFMLSPDNSPTFAEDQWVELVITGSDTVPFSATVSILGQKAGNSDIVKTSWSTCIGDEAAHPRTDDYSTVAWNASRTTYSETTSGSCTLSYMYTPDGVASPVTLGLSSIQRVDDTATGYATNLSYTHEFEYIRRETVQFNGVGTEIETYRKDSYDLTGAIEWLRLRELTGPVTEVYDLKVNGISVVGGGSSTTGTGGLTMTVNPVTFNGAKVWRLESSAPWATGTQDSITTTTPVAGVATYSVAMRTRIYSNLTAPSSTSSATETGEKRWFPVTYIDSRTLVNSTNMAFVLTREAFNLYTLSLIGEDSSYVVATNEPVCHFTPYGVLDITQGTVAKGEFEPCTLSSAVELSKAVFADGRNSAGGIVKYAKLDTGVYRARRYV